MTSFILLNHIFLKDVCVLVPEFALYNHLSYSFSSWHSLDFSLTFFCMPRLLCLCRVEILEILPVHSLNGIIISSARVCTLQSPFVFLFLMEGMRFVIVALPGLFFYLLFHDFVCVCVEVLRPSQPNGVMSSAVSLPNHTFTGQA